MKPILLMALFFAFACGCVPQPKEKTIEKIDEGKFDSLHIDAIPVSLQTKSRFIQHDSFPSRDSLLIFADIYERKNRKPTILLCHQAGFSRGEYRETAFRIASIGFSSIAIDQRSGNEANNIINKTAQLAKQKELPTEYIDAKQDIESAIDYLFKLNDNESIILVGSSYSASLVLLIGKNNDKVKAVAVFSPGEYIKGINIQDSITGYNKPIFITSSKTETEASKTLISGIDTVWTNHFQPDFEGIHGSSALWETTEGNEKYWDAFKTFLTGL
jgi:hypothetical protein